MYQFVCRYFNINIYIKIIDYVKKYWSYISNRHITDEMDKLEVIQNKTINQFTFFIALFLLQIL